jgi:hypothetical protein
MVRRELNEETRVGPPSVSAAVLGRLVADFGNKGRFFVWCRSIMVSFKALVLSCACRTLKTALTLRSLNHAIQNGLGASNSASEHETPISRRVRSLRFINSLRDRARRYHSAK